MDSDNVTKWDLIDWLLLARAYAIWALLLGQAAFMVLHMAGVVLTAPIIVSCLVVGGLVGLMASAIWSGATK